MKKLIFGLAISTLAFCLFAFTDAVAAVPGKINYQGKLTDSSGKLVADGSYSMTFKLFDALSGGTEKWSETHTGDVVVTNGLFNVMLGSTNSLTSVFQANDALCLEITIGAETLSPRQEMTSVGYALRTNDATGLARQAIINGNFVVNQRGYVSNAALAAGAYGHDRWKAGAGGGNYTFTQLPGSTTITIGAGKTLIQVIEDKNVIGGTYTLSWTGTAQARFGKDSATPSGTYAASPITMTGQTAGTVMSVEFCTGTLGTVQVCSGSVALPFMPKSYGQEYQDCLRYYEVIGEPGNIANIFGWGLCTSTTAIHVKVDFYPKRISPVCRSSGSFYTPGSPVSTTAITFEGGARSFVGIVATYPNPGLPAGSISLIYDAGNADSRIILDAEL